jgi:hypothetical protein
MMPKKPRRGMKRKFTSERSIRARQLPKYPVNALILGSSYDFWFNEEDDHIYEEHYRQVVERNKNEKK